MPPEHPPGALTWRGRAEPMCGFVAFFRRDGRPVIGAEVDAMRDAIRHRGPDDAGLFVEGPIGLGHARLSIIDLASGHQPMADASGRVWIAYNGEIYNFAELRGELAARGYPFRTRCDTEVILAGFVEHGADFFQRLNGIFAFALWDGRDERLTLVRDRVGVKPLYVYRDERMVAAASEIKALTAHPEVRCELEIDAVPEVLAYRQLAGRRTMFRGIETLEPGAVAVFSSSGEHRQRFWTLPTVSSSKRLERRLEEYQDELDHLLGEAVEMQLLSDVPVGTYNSGGVDSSLVTSYVAEVRGPDINTFCVGLDEASLDERPYARMVADRYRTRHRELVLRPHEFADHLADVNRHLDEPVNHPNTVAMYLLSRMTKEFATVVLTGEGCDEFFAGYPRYRIGRLLQRLGPLGRTGARRAVRLMASAGAPGSRAEKLLRTLGAPLEQAIQDLARYVPDQELNEVLCVRAPAWTAARREALTSGPDVVARLLEQDQRNYLQAILNRLDKASMAFGVEARVPFLDHRLLELAARLPISLKLHRGRNKYLVKSLADRRLPARVVHRKKSGLAMPLETWLRDERGLGRFLELLGEPRSQERPWIERAGLRRLVETFRRGERVRIDLLWGLVNLELFTRVAIDEAAARSLTTARMAHAPQAQPAGSGAGRAERAR